MPFRHAPLLVLLLLPLIVVGFWPNYFGNLRGASFALHAHGLTATVWIALVAAQGWSAQRRDRLVVHRAAGLAVFVVVPLFAAGGLLAIRGVIGLGLAEVSPFHARYGVTLALVDLVTVTGFVGLVVAALVERRRVWSHAAYMLSTVLLVLPPIFGRLLPMTPGYPIPGVAGFTLAFYVAQLGAAAALLFLARLYPRSKRPFMASAALLIVSTALFDTAGRSAWWREIATALASVPAPALAAIGVAASAASLWWAWGRRAVAVAARPLTPVGSA